MIKISSSTPFARPANTTPYSSGDLVANHATAGSVVPGNIGVHPTAGGLGKIKRCHLFKSALSVTLAVFRVHFFRTAPIVLGGDNAAFVPTHAGYLGAFDITVDRQFISGQAIGSTGIGVPLTGAGTEVSFDLPDTVAAVPSKRLYFLIEARAAYVPESGETFGVTAEIDYEP